MLFPFIRPYVTRNNNYNIFVIASVACTFDILQDKTFGLKNKKGAKNQKFIQQVQKQVHQGNQPARAAAPDKKEEKKKKDAELAELNALFRPVIQKAPKGT